MPRARLMSKSQPFPFMPCYYAFCDCDEIPNKSNLKKKGLIRDCGSGRGVEAVSEVAGHKQGRKAANACSGTQVASSSLHSQTPLPKEWF